MVTCPTLEKMNHLAEGDLSSSEIDALEQHLQECACCSRFVETLAVQNESSALAFADYLAKSQPVVESLIRTLELLRPAVPATDDASEALSSILAPPDQPNELGRLGPYRVVTILGRGGMGIVVEADDPDLQRKVAVKIMLPALLSLPSAKKRFLREAKMAASLRHKHIVITHQVGEQSGVPYLTMELLEGETLESRLKREPILSVAEILRIGREITEGLAAAHEQGFVHRDIKPSNLWLERETANVKILDFGLARTIDDSNHLTQTGVYLGTPAFMPPEQASGNAVDERGDLFSLGCVLYRMATGVVPFAGKDSLAIFWALASKIPVPPGQLNPLLPPALSALILRLLAKDPVQRPSSAAEVRAALDAVSADSPRRTSSIQWLVGLAAMVGIAFAVWRWCATGPELTPTVAAMPIQTASLGGLEFDGTGMVTIEGIPLAETGPYTLEAYVTVRQILPNRNVVIGAGEEGRAFAIEISSYRQPFPKWRFSWKFPHAIGEAPALIGQRTHVAATLTAKQVAFFVNGKRENSLDNPVVSSPGADIALVLGKNLKGTIDQVRISRICRYRAEFTPENLLTADADTLAVYRFAEGAGDVLHDSSGHERHGKISGPTWPSKAAN